MSVSNRIGINLRDLAVFGPTFLWRHSPRITGAEFALVPIPGFGKIYLRAGESDVATVRQIFADRQYDVKTRLVADRIMRRYETIVQSGGLPVIVDAGANIGAASIWFAKKYPKSHVVAVEPDPENFRVLSENAKLESRLTPIRAAIGSTRGFVSVNRNELGWATQTVRSDHGTPMITMTDAFETVGNGVPFIAKVDIEGFESDLFSCNIDWLGSVEVVYIEPHDWLLPGRMTSRSFQRAMGPQDFEIYINGDNLIYVRSPNSGHS
jgi:FkbM family methyltransferase